MKQIHKNEICQIKRNFLDDSVIFTTCYLAFTNKAISFKNRIFFCFALSKWRLLYFPRPYILKINFLLTLFMSILIYLLVCFLIARLLWLLYWSIKTRQKTFRLVNPAETIWLKGLGIWTSTWWYWPVIPPLCGRGRSFRSSGSSLATMGVLSQSGLHDTLSQNKK